MSSDLAAFNEVNHLVLVAAGVNIRVPRNRHSTRVQRRVPQRIAYLVFEPVCLRSLLNHDRVFYATNRGGWPAPKSFSLDSSPHDLDCQPIGDDCDHYKPE